MSTAKKIDLFANIPQSDFLGFSKNGEIRSKKVIEFLELNKNDVSVATGVPVSSIRYDKDRISKELKERIQEIANICQLVAQFFKGDAHKTAQWFWLPNPACGEISPRDLIRFGRYKKLLKMVHRSLQGELP